MTAFRNVLALTLLIAGADLQAQEVLPLNRLQLDAITKEKSSDINPCDDGFSFADAKTNIPDTDYEQIASCARLLSKAVLALNEASPSRDTNQKLIGIRVNYKKLKKWGSYRGLLKGDSARIGAKKALEDLGTQIDGALKSRDLFSQFAATLITGPTFTESQGSGSNGESKTLALGTVVWESRHFGDETLAPIDVSFGGRVGIQPVLTMVAPEDDLGDVSGAHQAALVWTMGVNLHKQHRGINAETGVFGRTGAAQLTAVPSVIDRGDGSVLSLPVNNGTGKAAWLWEGGVEFKMFDTRLAQVHAEKGTISPQFHASVSWKHDARFRGEGMLASYNRPQHRLVFRMMIDAIQVLDRRAFGQEAKSFTFGFAVEHERSLSSSGQVVPSATRYLIRGNLNLLKGLAGTDLPANGQP